MFFNEHMPKKDAGLEFEGRVVQCLPGTRFVVELNDNQHQVHCMISGRMRRRYIRLVMGDKVVVEMTPYDLSKGRIIYRK